MDLVTPFKMHSILVDLRQVTGNMHKLHAHF